MRISVCSSLRRHLYAQKANGLSLRAIAFLAGFTDPTGLIHQLHKPFAPTELNRTRWRVVADVSHFDGEPLQEEVGS